MNDHVAVRFAATAPVRFTAPGRRRETQGFVRLPLTLPVPRVGAGDAPLVLRAFKGPAVHERRVHGDLLLKPRPWGDTVPGRPADAAYLARMASTSSGAADLLGLGLWSYETIEIPPGSAIHEDGRPPVEAAAYRGATRLRLVGEHLYLPAEPPAIQLDFAAGGVSYKGLHDRAGPPDAFGFALDRVDEAARFATEHDFLRDRAREHLHGLRVEIAEGLAVAFPEGRANARQAARIALHAGSHGIADLPAGFVALLGRLAQARDAVMDGTVEPAAVEALLAEVHATRPRKDRSVSLDTALRVGRAAIAASLPYERGLDATLDPVDAGALGALAS